jgi:hypothetical protein
MKPKTREYRPGPDSPQTQVEAKLSPDVQNQIRELTDDERTINATLSALQGATGVGWSCWTTRSGWYFNPDEGSGLNQFAVSADALRMMATRASYWDTLRVLAGAPPVGDDQQPMLSPDVQNQIRELTDEHVIVELRDQLAKSELEVQILQKRAAELEAKLLQADDVIAELREEQYGPTTDEIRAMGHAEAVELADAMIAPAGFELLRDDGAAMWIQHLKDARPGVQVFFTIPEGILAAGPANVFAFVKANVGVAL